MPQCRLPRSDCTWQDDLAAAQFWAEQVKEATDTSLLYPCLGLTPVRIMLASHEKTAAAEKIKRTLIDRRQKGCGAGMVEVRTLQALAADTPDDALYFLQDALKRAQPEGFIRTFVDKRRADKGAPREAKIARGERKSYSLTLLAAFGKWVGPAKSQPLVEPMSERELEILRLLADGLSNREIAERLVNQCGDSQISRSSYS